MAKYVIEREIPGSGKFTPDQLQAASQKSCGAHKNLGPQIQWLHSYVADNKLYCVYPAPNEGWSGNTPAQAAFQRTESRK